MELKEKIEQERLALEYMENQLFCESFYFYNNGVYKTISSLSKDGWFADLKKVEPTLTNDVLKVFDLKNSINSKKSYGGTSFDNIKKMIQKERDVLK